MSTTKRKVGRPMVKVGDKNYPLNYNFFGVKNFKNAIPGAVYTGVPAMNWPNQTDADLVNQISVTLDGAVFRPSKVAVYLRRQKLIDEGKNVACKKAKFTRSKVLRMASEQKLKAKVAERKAKLAKAA
jgi:hypothetical protein